MNRVFISSVVRGFEAYRSAAKAGVELMGDVVVMSEAFGARPYPSRQACQTEIEGADIYLVVLGEDFGSEAEPGVSVTQAEYRYAQSLRKPTLAFVQKREMEERQAQFRREIEEGFDTGFFRASFDAPETLKDEVVKGLRLLGEARAAWPEERFIERVEQAIGTHHRRHGSGEAELLIAFIPQPSRSRHLPDLDEQHDDFFKSLCSAGLAVLRDGYKPLKDASMTGIETRTATLRLFDDGLRLLSVSPRAEREGFHFSDMFVPPSRVRVLATGAFDLFDANSGWCQIALRGMQHQAMRELPSEGTRSVSIPMSGADGAAEQRLFQPLTQGAYERWIEPVVARFARRFG